MLTRPYFSKLLIFLFASQLYLTTSFSQSTSYLDSLDGKFALQFQITDNFQLSNFQGSVLSGKYHFSSRDAVRLGLEIIFGDSEAEVELNNLDTNTVDQSAEDSSRFGFTINSQYIHYIRGTDDISLFGGVGPFFQHYKSTRTREIVEDEIETSSESETSHFSTGIDLIVGVEWWFHKSMSLSAEYGLKFSYSSTNNEFKDDTVEGESEQTSFNISGNHVNFGITVYF